MNPKTHIEIVPECGDAVAGRWGDRDCPDRGAVCWRFDHGSPAVVVPWPDTLFCRYCKRTYTKEAVQKKWLRPVYYTHKDSSFNCGCLPVDSSD